MKQDAKGKTLRSEDSTDDSLLNYFATSIKWTPLNAILESFSCLEQDLRELLGRSWGERRISAMPLELIQEAQKLGKVDAATVNSVKGLTSLRNLAIHAPEGAVTEERAREFVVMVDAVLFALRGSY